MTGYQPFYNSDMTEGRGHMVPCNFVFMNKSLAKEWMDLQPGIMGAKGPWTNNTMGHWQLREMGIIPYDSKLSDIKAYEIKLKKIAALKKLTPDERRLLGLE